MKNVENIKRILFVFDLDSTITKTGGDNMAFKILKDQNKAKELLGLFPKSSWCQIVNLLMIELKKEGITVEDYKNAIQSNSLNPGMQELLTFINSKKEKSDMVLVSGSNVFSVGWLLEKYNIKDYFKRIFANPAKLSEEKLIEIGSYQINDCSNCEVDLCKKLIVEDYLKHSLKEGIQYEKIIYVGDGHNDFCPVSILGSNDIAFPRIDFALYKKIYESEGIKDLNCEVIPWNDGYKILEHIKDINLL